MSVVTGVVLCTSCVEDEEEVLDRINAWLLEKGGGPRWSLKLVSDDFGGGKHPQMSVYGGGFNYFYEDDFAEFVISLPWQNPENVVLIMQPEDGSTKVFRPSES